jgi:hypothetical protein
MRVSKQLCQSYSSAISGVASRPVGTAACDGVQSVILICCFILGLMHQNRPLLQSNAWSGATRDDDAITSDMIMMMLHQLRHGRQDDHANNMMTLVIVAFVGTDI